MARHKPQYILIMVLAVIVSGLCASTSDDWISTVVEMLEMEYEDQCSQIAEAELSLMTGNKNALGEMLDAKKAFGDFAKNQVSEVRDINSVNSAIRRKLELIENPGDTLLQTDQWNALVSFSEMAIYNIENNESYDCRQDVPQSCTYSMLLSTIANSRDRHLLTSAKASWENKLPDEQRFESYILPLARNASNSNGFSGVKDYWESLSEYPKGYEKMQELWDEVEPLYNHLHKFLANRLEKLNGSLREDGSIPAQWLGSLFGDDWSNLAELALPNEMLYQEINKNMEKKFIAGRNAYKQASSLLVRLGIEPLKDTFWRDSKFDKACPSKLVHSCSQPPTVYVFTCQNRSLTMLMDAHEKMMKAKHIEIKVQQRSNTYIIREANRFSALDVALSELGSLLLLNTHQLDAEEVLPLKKSSQMIIKNPLLLIAALRDLPRLAYYMAADTWRLKLLENSRPINIGASWAQTRRNLTKVSPSDKDYLGDFNILTNKPYLSNFLGIILKYQIYNYLTEDIYEDNADIVRHVSKKTPKLKELMSKGYSEDWMDIISKSLNIYSISSNPMLNYFQPLTDFLSSLDPNSTPQDENIYDFEEDNDINYENANEDSADDDKSGSVEETPVLKADISETESKVIEKANEVNNNIDSDSNTENYEDNPNLIPKDEGSPAASSSDVSNRESDTAQAPQQSQMPYLWIALGIFILIIIILAIVIGRKRYKHKKELERERREGTA